MGHPDVLTTDDWNPSSKIGPYLPLTAFRDDALHPLAIWHILNRDSGTGEARKDPFESP
jgi:hypothetical protein